MALAVGGNTSYLSGVNYTGSYTNETPGNSHVPNNECTKNNYQRTHTKSQGNASRNPELDPPLGGISADEAGPTRVAQTSVYAQTKHHPQDSRRPTEPSERLRQSQSNASHSLRHDPAPLCNMPPATQDNPATVLLVKQTWGPDLRNRLKFLVDARVQGQPLRILFDTGASKNLITQQATWKLRLHTQPAHQPLALHGAFSQQSTLATHQIVLPKIAVRPGDGDRETYIPSGTDVWVTPGAIASGVDVILGDPYLSRHKAKLDFQEHCLSLQNEGGERVSVSLYQEDDPAIDVLDKTAWGHFYRKTALDQNQGWHFDIIHVCVTGQRAVPEDSTVCTISDGTGDEPDRSSTGDTGPAEANTVTSETAPEALEEAQRILEDYQGTFLGKDEPLPRRGAENPLPPESHTRIPTYPDAEPTHEALRRMSPEKLKFLREDLNKLLVDGHIQPSSSPFAAPVLYAFHPTTGKRRLCVDYRKLNDITIKDKTPLMSVGDLMGVVGAAKPKYFSVLDMKKGYYQIPMDPEDVHKTAFRTRYGLFEFLVTPFGLCNAPANFSRVMNTILSPWLDRCCVAYLDDILVFSRTKEEHERHLRDVVGALQQYGFALNRDKCRLFTTEVTFLNYRISQGTVRVVPSYVQALKDHLNAPPRDKTGVRRFLGVANFYRQFIRGFAKTAEPLIALTRANTRFPDVWPEACQQAMRTLIDALASGPILRLPADKPYILYTDASDVAVGACLMQRDDTTGKPMPIAYFSRTLQGPERRYSAFDRELLGILAGLIHFRPHLESRDDTTVYTDHQPIIGALKQPLQPNDRQARWIQRITAFRPTVKYVPGKDNNVADLLSRPPAGDVVRLSPTPGAEELAKPQSEPHDPALDVIFYVDERDVNTQQYSVSQPGHSDLLQQFQDAAKECGFYASVCQARASRDPNPAVLNEQFRGVKFADIHIDEETRLLYRVRGDINGVHHRQYIVPACPDLRARLLDEHHAARFGGGHLGREKVLKRLEHTFWWPGMRTDVETYIAKCPVCQTVKPSNQRRPGLLKPFRVDDLRPMSNITMDFVGPLPVTHKGNQYVLTVVDQFSKFMVLIPLRSLTVEATVTALQRHYCSVWGTPNNILTDRGSQFMSAFWRQLWATLGTTLSFSSAYHPQTDGQSERANRTWKDMVRCYLDRQNKRNWDELLPSLQYAYNTSMHAGSRRSPFELVFGFTPVVPATIGFPQPANNHYLTEMHNNRERAKEFLKAYQIKMKLQADKKRRPVTYKVGDLVLVDASGQHLTDSRGHKRSALDARYHGPYRVVEIINENAIRLDLDDQHDSKTDVINVEYLKPAPGAAPPESAPQFSDLAQGALEHQNRAKDRKQGSRTLTPAGAEDVLDDTPPMPLTGPTVTSVTGGPRTRSKAVAETQRIEEETRNLREDSMSTPTGTESGSVDDDEYEPWIEISEADSDYIHSIHSYHSIQSRDKPHWPRGDAQAGTACIWKGGVLLQPEHGSSGTWET